MMSVPSEVEGSLRVGFIMEQSSGHLAHFRNLSAAVAQDSTISPVWVPIPYRADDCWEIIPGIRRNWSLRGGLRSRQRLRAELNGAAADVLLFHTQVTALCSIDFMRRFPSIISLDATPINMDEVSAGYRHVPGSRDPLNPIKFRWNQRVLTSAARLVPWSNWAARSLIDDYAVGADRVTVIPPGVDLHRWRPAERRLRQPHLPKLLFVGGDFRRKGGRLLLEVFHSTLSSRCRLDIVTEDTTLRSDGSVTVHHGLRPNDPALRKLFAEADLFVLPTLGDCMPLVITEAMASGLPVISSRIGAVPEQVEHGVTGLLIKPGDGQELLQAVMALLDDSARRVEMSAAARARAELLFDARRNYSRLLDLLKSVGMRRTKHEDC